MQGAIWIEVFGVGGFGSYLKVGTGAGRVHHEIYNITTSFFSIGISIDTVLPSTKS